MFSSFAKFMLAGVAIAGPAVAFAATVDSRIGLNSTTTISKPVVGSAASSSSSGFGNPRDDVRTESDINANTTARGSVDSRSTGAASVGTSTNTGVGVRTGSTTRVTSGVGTNVGVGTGANVGVGTGNGAGVNVGTGAAGSVTGVVR